jgi:hypothetical protein
LIEYLSDLLRANKPSTDAHAPYYAALQKLTVEKWRDG